MESARAGLRRTWYGRKEFWIVLGLLLMLSAVWFDASRETEPVVARSVEPSDNHMNIAEPSPGSFDAAMTEPNGPVAADDSARPRQSGEIAMPPACKRAPIRGCAPSKDDRGCYHCARCWRPYHYDVERPVNTISFSCQEMPDAPLYVELTETAQPVVSQRWTVAVSFGGQRVEQRVSPNLGGAFYAGFHGGTVELTAKLESCESSSTACQGDIDVVVNAK
jgi:hypothetical protein